MRLMFLASTAISPDLLVLDEVPEWATLISLVKATIACASSANATTPHCCW
jgi:hypothetical protein